jgi:hypothetical protein
MEIYNLPEDVKVFGFTVESFPAGIGEAFELLIKAIPGGSDRSYYGISYLDENGQMIYKATALEKFESEAGKYIYDRYLIEKGEYLSVPVYSWREKTNCIKDVFYEIIQDNRVDKTKPAIEWYKNDHEMMCMVRTIH